MRRLLRSRGARKFSRNRLAMAALGVIAVYFLTALWVLLGGISMEATRQRVAPKQAPGFLETPTLEERVAFSMHYVDEVDQAVRLASRRDQDAYEILGDKALAERRAARMSTDEYNELLDEAYAILEEELEAVEDLSHHPELEPRVERLEAIAAALYPVPQGWEGVKYRLRTFLGSDAAGQSISVRAIYSVKVAFQIGLITSVVSVIIGSLLGAAAAFFGGWLDHVITWIFSTLSSIPYLVLLSVLIVVFFGTVFDNPERPFLSLVPVYVAFCSTFWIGPCRVIRGETMKIKELEYVQAATAIGFSRLYILVRHVIPNTAHLMFINFSLLFIGAIKSEVILSFLGLGVKGQPSWGIMIRDAKDEVITYFFWQIGAATVLMFVLVLAFNILTDALQDAFDPKHVD
ncbi:MAG: ABC transporter permease [Phycisphaerales bacterium]|nr:ABC transporter permease [Phycisphaerales bacterium]